MNRAAAKYFSTKHRSSQSSKLIMVTYFGFHCHATKKYCRKTSTIPSPRSDCYSALKLFVRINHANLNTQLGPLRFYIVEF